VLALGACLLALAALPAPGQEKEAAPPAANGGNGSLPAIPPVVPDEAKVLPINLPAALKLAGARPLEIALAQERLQVAAAQLNQAKVLWLPTVTIGGDYFRHDAKIQDVVGNVFNTSKSSLMFGVGSGIGQSAVLSFTEAIFAPLVARKVVQAREAEVRTAANDALLDVTEAYLTVQQARGELAGAAEVTRHAAELEGRVEKLAAGLVPPLEAVRAKAELARRRQAELVARQRWRLASADLIRVLNLDPTTEVEPAEPPHLRIALFDPRAAIDDLLALALASRPELAAQQALVEAAQTQVKQEKCRPWLPNLLVRGASTTVTGTLGAGIFGGGVNSTIGNYGGRLDCDVQLLWQLDNLGFGNCARVEQRQAETRVASVELARIQTRVSAEVSRALAELRLAGERIDLAEGGLRLAQESLQKNLEGLRQTRRVGDTVTLVVRPQEAVAAVQALAQAYVDYYGAIADANRAQFRLYRALGQPAHLLCQGGGVTVPPGPPATLPAPEQRLPPPLALPAPAPEK
jgi:outer membrane protein TolC